MVSLFQSAFADLRDVREVPTDLGKKLPSNHSLSEEQSVKGIGVVRALFRKTVEILQCFIRFRLTVAAERR